MVKNKSTSEDISIAEATRRIIQSKPSLIDAIKQGVINYSALAESINPEVTKLIGKKERKIQIDAIKMALMRYAEEIKEKWKILEKDIIQVISNSKLELKNELNVITFRQSVFLEGAISITELMEGTDFFQLIQGTGSFTLVVDARAKDKIIKKLTQRNILMIKENQSALIVVSPLKIIEVPGIVAYFTDLFSRNGINITQFMSCHTDTIFVVSREDSLKAFKILEDRILLLRSNLRIEEKIEEKL
ncbi:MAG: DUF7523 family protein [Candidatus Helarchaeota archaeon]